MSQIGGGKARKNVSWEKDERGNEDINLRMMDRQVVKVQESQVQEKIINYKLEKSEFFFF